LVTSKEELQSMKEELTTLNSQLQAKGVRAVQLTPLVSMSGALVGILSTDLASARGG
jgi:hypothetical protein